MVPEALDALTPEERQQVYAMLRLEVEVDADGQMEARGVLSAFVMGAGGEGPEFCESGVTSGCCSQKQNSLSYASVPC